MFIKIRCICLISYWDCDYYHIYSESTSGSCGEGKTSIKERRALLEVAQQEAQIIKQQLSENIRKLDAAKARIRVLESESSSFKAHIHMLTDKGARNDEFIQILQVNDRKFLVNPREIMILFLESFSFLFFSVKLVSLRDVFNSAKKKPALKKRNLIDIFNNYRMIWN